MVFTKDERRREARALTAALIQVTDEFEDLSTCVLEDLSPSGARVYADIALQEGMKVTLKVESVTHSGLVRHCERQGDGYSVGICFHQGEWPAPIQFPVHWIRTERE